MNFGPNEQQITIPGSVTTLVSGPKFCGIKPARSKPLPRRPVKGRPPIGIPWRGIQESRWTLSHWFCNDLYSDIGDGVWYLYFLNTKRNIEIQNTVTSNFSELDHFDHIWKAIGSKIMVKDRTLLFEKLNTKVSLQLQFKWVKKTRCYFCWFI